MARPRLHERIFDLVDGIGGDILWWLRGAPATPQLRWFVGITIALSTVFVVVKAWTTPL